MKVFALVPLLMLLTTGCVSASPNHIHNHAKPVKKIVIVTPHRVTVRSKTKTVIIKRQSAHRSVTTRTIVKGETASFTTRLRKHHISL